MSGGTDLNWGAREAVLRRVLQRHPGLSIDELDALVEQLYGRIARLREQETQLAAERWRLEQEMDDIVVFLMARPREVENARKSLEEPT